MTPDEEAGPDFSLRLKGIDGPAGAYTVKLSDNPVGVPAVTSVSAPRLKGNPVSTGSFTLSGTSPAGGMSVDFRVQSVAPSISIGRIWIPGGVRSGTCRINVGRIAANTTATISAFTPVGSPASVTVSVQKS